jgi:hypothetical protein
MARISNLFLFIFIPAVLISCAKQWQDPNTSVPYTHTTIREILIAPIGYDGGGVSVEGMVWNLNYDLLVEDEKEIPYTSFKIADSDGNYINVFAEGNYPLTDGDQVKVIGVYRRQLVSENRKYINEIEANNIQLGRTSTLYKVYRYLR